MHFATWLEHTAWVRALSNSNWMYSVCEITHYFSLFILVGTAAIVDLRVLGVAARSRSATQLAKTFFPWSCLGLALVVLSGFLMYTTDATNYATRTALALGVKLATMALAIVTSAIVFRGAPAWDKVSKPSVGARTLALLSLALWIGTIIAAVEIPAVTGVG